MTPCHTARVNNITPISAQYIVVMHGWVCICAWDVCVFVWKIISEREKRGWVECWKPESGVGVTLKNTKPSRISDECATQYDCNFSLWLPEFHIATLTSVAGVSHWRAKTKLLRWDPALWFVVWEDVLLAGSWLTVFVCRNKSCLCHEDSWMAGSLKIVWSPPQWARTTPC